MTEVELQDARKLFVQHSEAFAYGSIARAGLAVMDYVDFLHALLHDLREESSAYARGVEEGRRLEREEQQRMLDAIACSAERARPTAPRARIPDVPDTHDV